MLKKGKLAGILSILLIGMFVFMTAGCAPTTTAPTQSPGAGETDVTVADDGREMVGNMYKTGIPIVKEKVTYNFLGMQMNNTRPNNLDETEMMMKIAEETGVSIDWELIPQASWAEKKNLTIASGEYPDAFFGPFSLSQDDCQKYGADGVLIPIDDLLEEYAPNISAVMEEYPAYKGFITSMDGNIYQLATLNDIGFDSLTSWIINKEWLDNLNLSVPTTVDEFYSVLKAFKENDANGNGDKNDEIPFSFLYQEGPNLNREIKRDFRPLYYAFGSLDTPFYINIGDDDEVFFTAEKEEWKEATKFMSELYQEGLIDPEVFTQDRTLLTNKLRTQQTVGVYTDYRKDNSMAGPDNEDNYTFMPALKSPDGKQIWQKIDGYGEGSFAITSKAEDPEVLIRWIDHCNQETYAPQMQYGMFKPAGFSDTEALVPSQSSPGKYEQNSSLRPDDVDPSDWFMSAPIAQGCTLLTKEVREKYVAKRESDIAKENACNVYKDHLSKWHYNYAYKFTTEELEELTLLQTDIVNYVMQIHARWIVDGGVDEEWDDYIAELKRLNVDRYVELYATAFDRIEK